MRLDHFEYHRIATWAVTAERPAGRGFLCVVGDPIDRGSRNSAADAIDFVRFAGPFVLFTFELKEIAEIGADD